jgi:hypothetical protein
MIGVDVLFSTIGSILSKRIFSKALGTVGKRFIGWWDVNSLGGFPGFEMRIICATFHRDRKYPLSKTSLNNWVRYFSLIPRKIN